jgi:hypothetical protein
VRDDDRAWANTEWTELVQPVGKRSGFTGWVSRLAGTSLQVIEENYGYLVANAARQRLAMMAML